MKFDDLQRLLGQEVVFRASTLLAGPVVPAHLRRQLARWVASGKVLRLRRGVYALAEPYANRSLHPFLLANELQRASYVSLQSALANYGMIPEFVPNITSVTSGRPEQIETPLGRFLFRHVKHGMLYGMESVEVAPGQWARMACREKALMDLLYLTPGSDDPYFLEQLRLDLSPPFHPDRMRDMVRSSGSAKLQRAVDAAGLLAQAERKGRRR